VTETANSSGVSPLACVMDAIAPDQRQSHLAKAKDLFRAVAEICELPAGYAFRLPNESDILKEVAEFISLERLCCPFFAFTLEVEPEGGAVWLQLTGRDGVKEFIRAEIGTFTGPSLRFPTAVTREQGTAN
jgi:hypothetical protein